MTASANGAGDDDNPLTDGEYAALIAINNVAQNSWRMNWFVPFDPSVDGNYEIELGAFDGGLNSVALTSITVIAGAGASVPLILPEPTTSAMLVAGMLGLFISRRRQRRRA